MIHIILLLLLALTGAAEEAPEPAGEVVTETCDPLSGRDCTTTPSELPGPRPI